MHSVIDDMYWRNYWIFQWIIQIIGSEVLVEKQNLY